MEMLRFFFFFNFSFAKHVRNARVIGTLSKRFCILRVALQQISFPDACKKLKAAKNSSASGEFDIIFIIIIIIVVIIVILIIHRRLKWRLAVFGAQC